MVISAAKTTEKEILLDVDEATKMLHGKDAALRAQKTAKNIFEKGSIGDDLQSVEIKIKLIGAGYL